MNGRTWIPLAVGTALVAAVAAYAITNARHAGIDAPRDEATPQTAADAWLGSNVAVPAGTEFALRLQSTLSTKTTREGDRAWPRSADRSWSTARSPSRRARP